MQKHESLHEGITFIQRKFPFYVSEELCDKINNKIYSAQLIEESLKGYGVLDNFYNIFVFDCLIGNSDRHDRNWGLVYSEVTKGYKLCPLYDNGSSLCSYQNEGDIDDILRDNNRFEAMISSK